MCSFVEQTQCKCITKNPSGCFILAGFLVKIFKILKSFDQLLETARNTLQLEARALEGVAMRLDGSFVKTIELMLSCTGKVVVTGVGKSAIIGQKLVATFNSTGTPSAFLHAADAVHGDLGTLQSNDVVVALSKSGDTPELKVLLPIIQAGGQPIIAICGKRDSFLGRICTVFLDTEVDAEACPNNLAPTTSTTAQLGMGDALAVCLLECRNFSSEDFGRFHPGGMLGKRLFLKVSDLVARNAKPCVGPAALLSEVVMAISSGRLGAVAVQEDERILGIVTDGDLRRMLAAGSFDPNTTAAQLLNPSPKIVDAEALAVEALSIMKAHNVSQLIVLQNNAFAGMVHIQDLMREGLL
jgi:arabinose-5-phosphate isomerase